MFIFRRIDCNFLIMLLRYSAEGLRLFNLKRWFLHKWLDQNRWLVDHDDVFFKEAKCFGTGRELSEEINALLVDTSS